MATTGTQRVSQTVVLLPQLSHDPDWGKRELVLRNIPKAIQSLQCNCMNAPLLCRLFISSPP